MWLNNNLLKVYRGRGGGGSSKLAYILSGSNTLSTTAATLPVRLGTFLTTYGTNLNKTILDSKVDNPVIGRQNVIVNVVLLGTCPYASVNIKFAMSQE